MAQLEGVYRAQRTRLRSLATAATARAFSTYYHDREKAIARIVPVVLAAQRQQVALVDAYMTAKTRAALGVATVKGLDPAAYTIDALRGVAAATVYERPWGALGGQLDSGANFASALGSAQAYLASNVATDIQMAQTYSARDWMSGDERIVGYRRLVNGTCDYCEENSAELQNSGDTLALHENCQCTSDPVFPGQIASNIELGDISEAARLQVLGGVDSVLGPYGMKLDYIRAAVAGRGIPGMSAAVWESGGGALTSRAGRILVRADMLDDAAALRRGEEALGLWRKDASASLLDKASRYAAWQDAARPVQTIIAHESAHELFWRAITPRAWASALRSSGVTLEDRFAVSVYAASDPKELFAEAMAMRATGRQIPERIATALDAVLPKSARKLPRPSAASVEISSDPELGRRIGSESWGK